MGEAARERSALPGLCDRAMEIVHGARISREVKLGVGVYFPHGDAHIHGATTIGDSVVVGVHSGIGLRGSFFSRDMRSNGPDDRCLPASGRVEVLGAITIGERAVVGAGAVVLEDVPEAATVVGVPARVVRQGPVGDELLAALERLDELRPPRPRRRTCSGRRLSG